MVELLPKLNINDTLPAYDDRESVTLLRHAGLLHNKVNEMISSFNKLEKLLTEAQSKFETNVKSEHTIHETAMRQEFQDFIDTMDIYLKTIEKDIANYEENLKVIIGDVAGDILNQTIAKGGIELKASYNEENEALSLVFTETEGNVNG